MATSTVRPSQAKSSIRRTVTKTERDVLWDLAQTKIDDNQLADPERRPLALDAIALFEDLGWDGGDSRTSFELTMPDERLEGLLRDLDRYVGEGVLGDVADLDECRHRMEWAYCAVEEWTKRGKQLGDAIEYADAQDSMHADQARERIEEGLRQRAVVRSLLGVDDPLPSAVMAEATMHDAIGELRERWGKIGTLISEAARGGDLDALEAAVDDLADLEVRAREAALAVVRALRERPSTANTEEA